MDISPFGIIKNSLCQVPLIVKTAILAFLGRSPNTDVQDALTEIIAVAARPVMSTPTALLKSQTQFKIDYGVWGRMWIAKYTIPASQSDVSIVDGAIDALEALKRAIKALWDGPEDYELPKVIDVEAEWTAYRGGVGWTAKRPKILEREQYDNMMREVEPDSPVILYFHGGAFCLMDPSTHRWTTSSLAQHTRGRCLSVRYRLSPQNTFPAALLDAFLAYLSLLSPPPGSFHSPVPPSQIVIAGDSSGAGLAASLLLLLITLPRIGIPRLRFHHDDLDISSLPAGLALTSPWLDISRSLPSVIRNCRYDIIAPPSTDLTIPHPNFPPDSVWPTQPPRVETYCNASMVNHPLVSPLAARQELWRGCPPVYLSVGWEGMQDEAEVFARRVYAAGGTVLFDGYEGMPHCFSVVPWNRAGRAAFGNWAAFCRQAVSGNRVEQRDFAIWTDKHGIVKEVKLVTLGMRENRNGCVRDFDLDDDMVEKLMAQQKEWRVRLERELRDTRERSGGVGEIHS